MKANNLTSSTLLLFQIAGQREFQPWFSAWSLELALKHNVVIVNPDYRLLPEASGEDILDDLDDFWKWLERDLGNALEDRESYRDLTVDLNKILIYGDSAGGYLSVQTALSHYDPSSKAAIPRIRAIISAYPMLDLRSKFWTTDYEKPMFGNAQIPEAFIEQFISSISSTPAVISNAGVIDSPRMQLAIALGQHGRFLEVLGTDRNPTPGKRRIHPEDRIIDGRILPPALFLHGKDDSAVPVTGTKTFVELLRKHKSIEGLTQGNGEDEVLKLVLEPGEHGFDGELGMNDTEWMKDSIVFIEKHWLE